MYDLHNSVGQVQLFRMRTGSYLTAQRLAQMKIISPDRKFAINEGSIGGAKTNARDQLIKDHRSVQPENARPG